MSRAQQLSVKGQRQSKQTSRSRLTLGVYSYQSLCVYEFDPFALGREMSVGVANSRRRELIRKIGERRKSSVITYVLGDRRGVSAQIAEDAVRPIYDHLLKIGRTKKIDIYLYSVGGQMEVPWRVVSMVREFADELGILIPYKSMSAATMIALGADEVIVGKKGELGPIDPQITIQRGDGGTAVQDTLSVEDVMSYVRFLKERAGLSDQSALSGLMVTLADKLTPWALGQINRVHSHIREVARKLLSCHHPGFSIEGPRAQVIVEILAEKTYQHGHAISRREAKEIGLNIIDPDKHLENSMWTLFEEYESLMKLRDPIDPRSFVPRDKDEFSENVIIGCIESSGMSHHHSGVLYGKVERPVPSQLSVNLNLNLALPQNIDPSTLTDEARKTLQEMVQKLQPIIQEQVQNEIRRQMPAKGIKISLQNSSWRKSDQWPTSPRRGQRAQRKPG